ncbi:MAG: TonB-dependent receptor [Chitinophaga sp.]|jgi:iron complex outermembrane recepter protein|nr:TonB-dependent receptor [Chitinophaga sp.]
MKKIITLLSGSILYLSAFSQTTNTTVKGNVSDANNNPLQTVTVSLLKAKDSSLVKVEITNQQGAFSIKANTGKYLVSYNIIGFEKKFSEPFTLADNQTLTLPTIQLTATAKKLQDVTVTAKKPMIEIKADKTVFNVENSITATGSNALEILQKSPGIQVDNNDNISMQGKTGIKIYVDGKMVQLDNKNLAEYLKSIQSSDVEAIEMIPNPSAKYDASGNAGVINIRLKKNKRFGTNGSLSNTFTQGVTPKDNASLSLNYRDKKINLFSNIGGSVGNNENLLNLYRVQKDTLYDQHAVNTSQNKGGINAKVGADLFLDNKNTVGFMVTGNFSNNLAANTSNTNIYYNPTGAFIKSLEATNTIPGNRNNANINLNYRYADTSGTEINFDADHGIFRGRGTSTQPNYYFDKNGNPFYSVINKNNTPIDIYIYTAKVDAEIKAWKGKLGFGAKTSFVKTNNTFDFYNVQGASDIKILNKSNSFLYKENVNAAYVNFQKQLNTKWSLQVGIRIEQTNSHGILTRADSIKQADDDVPRDYLNFFPSGALTWNLNKKNTLNLTYSRRIDRPTYQDLNPFENKLDELTYQKGNAFLRPQYTDNVELTHTFMGFINTSVGYSYIKDYATQVTDTTGNATYVQQQNLATQQIISFNIGAPLPIKKWWNGYVNLWYNQQMFKGTIGGKDVTQNIPLYGAYLQQTFSLGKDYTLETSGWLNGPSIWGGTWKTKAQGGLDVGAQKLLLKKKATLKLTVTDIFKTSPWTATSDFGGLYIRGNGSWESRTLRVSFTYRFGNNQVKAARQRQAGSDSEAKRIGG